MKNIKDPIGVKELLHEKVEQMKLRRRLRVSELTNTEGDTRHCCHEAGDDEEIED